MTGATGMINNKNTLNPAYTSNITLLPLEYGWSVSKVLCSHWNVITHSSVFIWHFEFKSTMSGHFLHCMHAVRKLKHLYMVVIVVQCFHCIVHIFAQCPMLHSIHLSWIVQYGCIQCNALHCSHICPISNFIHLVHCAMHCSHICPMSNFIHLVHCAMHCSHICAMSNVDGEAQEVYSPPPPVIISPHTARHYWFCFAMLALGGY